MQRRVPTWALLLVVAGVLLQAWYACGLNRLYYSRYSPFFDSMSYTNQLANLLSIAKTDGFVAALRTTSGQSTVFLPWVIAAALGPILPYSRLVGIWIQEIWMAALGVSLLFYWREYRGAPLGFALLWTVPPLSFAAVYRANGGVSDFRMDLSLYLLFSLVITWYLATRETDSRLPWVLSGVAMALCCMNRATAPVYLGVALGPALLARWWCNAAERGLLARRVAAYWLPLAFLGLLPVIKNWSYVHYYYFVWGADPNANLPLTKSVIHLYLAARNMGFGMVAAAALLVGLQVAAAKRWDLDWALIWIAAAPTLLLVATGAGLNAFASMPTVFGCLLFSIAPYRRSISTSTPVRSASLLLLLMCLYQAGSGYLDHAGKQDGSVPSMAASKNGIELIRSESRQKGIHQAQFLTAHIVDFQATALRNVLVYEFGAAIRGNAYVLPEGLALHADYEGLFAAAVPVNWAEIPGASDPEKFRHLVSVANAKVNFFFLPDEPSIDWMEKNRAYNYSNIKVRELKRQLLATGAWRKTGAPLRVSNFETVDLYVNSQLTR